MKLDSSIPIKIIIVNDSNYKLLMFIIIVLLKLFIE